MMRKPVRVALQKVFAAEIDNRLPFQSRAKIYATLCTEGMLAPMEVVYGGRFPVIVQGYQLTQAGRIDYCETCRGEADQDRSWFCEQCKVEVDRLRFDRRCPHCGKTEREKA